MSYAGRPVEELLKLLVQRDTEIDEWRRLWRQENQLRAALETRLGLPNPGMVPPRENNS